jgi:hypothetical protein
MLRQFSTLLLITSTTIDIPFAGTVLCGITSLITGIALIAGSLCDVLKVGISSPFDYVCSSLCSFIARTVITIASTIEFMKGPG